MKILFVLDSLNRGGAEVLALDVVKNARRHQLDISVATTRGGALENEFRAAGIKLYFVTRKLPLDPRAIWQLRKIIKKERISIVHAHQAVDALHVYFATLGSNVKNFLSWHGGRFTPKNKLILRSLYKRFDANIAVSRDFKKRIGREIHIDSDDFRVVYNGVDPSKLYELKNSFRTELQISEQDIIFGMVGNFYSEARDQYTVCKALPFFFKQIPTAKFVFVGNRLKENQYLFDRCVDFCAKNNLSDKVIFLQGRSDIPSILADLDVFVFSSLADTFGIALVEAMLAGVPCICSDIGPLLEVTDNGKYGLLFKTGDEKDLAEKMIEMARNAEARQKLGESGKQWALGEFSIDRHISRLKEVYEKT